MVFSDVEPEDRDAFGRIYYPNFDGNGINLLPEGIRLVLRSKNSWPMIPGFEAVSFYPQSWDCQLGFLDFGYKPGASIKAAKVMLLVEHSPDSYERATAFLRMARLFFDDLRPVGFDDNDNEIDAWMLSRHGWTRETNTEIFLGKERECEWFGFFIEEEAGMGAIGSAWETPDYLYVQIREIGVDPSFGTTRVLNIWNCVETLENWRKTSLGGLDFEAYSRRVEAQSKSLGDVVKHLDSVTYFGIWGLTN